MSHSAWFIIFIISLIISVTGAAATTVMIIKFGIVSSLMSLKKDISELSSEYSENDYHPVKTENLGFSGENRGFDFSDRAASGTVVINRPAEERTGTILSSESFSVTKSIIISYGNPEKVKLTLKKHSGKY